MKQNVTIIDNFYNGTAKTKVTICCRAEVFVDDCSHLLTEFQGWNLSSKIKVRSQNFNTYRFFHSRVLQI